MCKTTNLKHTASLFVDKAGNPLDAAPPGQTSDGGLGDALDVVPQHLPVTLGASLAQSLASFTTSSHFEIFAISATLCRVCYYL